MKQRKEVRLNPLLIARLSGDKDPDVAHPNCIVAPLNSSKDGDTFPWP